MAIIIICLDRCLLILLLYRPINICNEGKSFATTMAAPTFCECVIQIFKMTEHQKVFTSSHSWPGSLYAVYVSTHRSGGDDNDDGGGGCGGSIG